MAQLQRWTKRLSNITVSPITRDYPEHVQNASETTTRPIEAWKTVELPDAVEAALSKLQEYGDYHHSSFVVFLSALVVLVSRLTGDENVTLDTSDGDGIPFVLQTPVDLRETFIALMVRIAKVFSELAADAIPMDDLRKHMNQQTFAQVGIHQSGDGVNQDIKHQSSNSPDLTIYLSYKRRSNCKNADTIIKTPQDLSILHAKYDQRKFSSSRISFTLAQLLQLVQSAASNPEEAVGKLDLMTVAQRHLLPDPQKDLHWSKFEGAIHDIFAANAERHPDRLCVVETAFGSTSQREFTYRQIHWASNVLAHHLVQSGVQKGEVVMIYAYRGVDLVVAVIGVLKAGATFSVIDPLYPADRQVIYLKVAQPRALINLQKATQEAGELSDKVRCFIKDNLQLRTEIPALAISDDGTLIGGNIHGEDVLRNQQALKTRSTAILVGPDDIPTLSFTSGSEGIPKGVKGRHFSLAYYFPWMAQRFNLGMTDRFTMLSGIAHDPIQRDIFTPLFLGAQLLVPSKDDIQYEQLAEWMKKYGATVTHLTPAMGQILVGNALAEFSKLHHAFFVGDILIKRDCKSLQRLAPNVRIVNMYGTTETQRAVSYYEIPSFNDDSTFLENMKDVIPAGRGMSEDIQLLVVNRTDPTKLCGIGEVGEIYVRAGGLAEGYLGQQELTEKKFKPNWFLDPQKWVDEDAQKADSKREPWRRFYQGPRDRLYRSGDLGRYSPSGDVECSGRADDQVKIRGFRVELGEIDTHLSKHPLVRENVTLVRRNRDEEATLVSYVVPQMNAWLPWLEKRGLEDEPDAEGMVGLLRRFRPLRDDVREALKTKLPSYSVPSTIIPLRKMPLNPNGKVDKPALPFPDISELSAAAPRLPSAFASELTETETLLAAIWARLLQIKAELISVNDSFFDLGGDSLRGNRMIFEVRKTWRVEVGMNLVFRSPTLKDFALSIDKLRDPAAFESNIEGTAEINGVGKHSTQFSEDYAVDAQRLVKELPQNFPFVEKLDVSRPITVLLTGATGFLGSFILRDLLSRELAIHVIAHVRAKSSESGLLRIKETCQAYGVWSPSWASRIRCVTGNLGEAKLGLSDETWEDLTRAVDVVIHNGALVHWVYPYSKLKAPNVQGTIDALKLCSVGQPKIFVFVSSTSVLDNEHYIQLSDRLCNEGKAGVPENDDLEGSSTGLGIGYGQVKWVSERLTQEAGRRGLRGAIIRPGYISGDSQTGATNTDDFLIRMLKGCIQLSAHPDISNTINMCPVNFVARLVVAAAMHPANSLNVIQCTSHPRLRFNEYLGMLRECGYDVPRMDYIPWRASLERYVAQDTVEKETQHALLPLYHFVTADLPSSTKSPELDDSNAVDVLQSDFSFPEGTSTTKSDVTFNDQNKITCPNNKEYTKDSAVNIDIMKKYVSWLIAVGFLSKPSNGNIQAIDLKEGQREALGRVGGRGGTT